MSSRHDGKLSRPPEMIETRTGFLRSRWLWFGILVAAYFTSAAWLGKLVFTSPHYVLFFAPSGIMWILWICGGFYDEPTSFMVMIVLHHLFWPFFALFLWNLPRLKVSTFRFGAVVFVLLIVTTLGSCARLTSSECQSPRMFPFTFSKDIEKWR